MSEKIAYKEFAQATEFFHFSNMQKTEWEAFMIAGAPRNDRLFRFPKRQC